MAGCCRCRLNRQWRNAHGRSPCLPSGVCSAFVAEHLGQQTRSAMTDEMTVIVRDNAGAFLTTMLQRVQAEVGESGGVRVTPNAKNTAFLVDVFEFS